MPDVANKYPSQISGGQQQRAAIARALANDPKLIVGDEPTGNLDMVSAGIMFALFEDLVAQGKTIVMVTHDKDLAGQIPRVEEVRDGQLVAQEEIDSRLVAKEA
jgi:putative ABC transport system ATP-binding protein